MAVYHRFDSTKTLKPNFLIVQLFLRNIELIVVPRSTFVVHRTLVLLLLFIIISSVFVTNFHHHHHRVHCHSIENEISDYFIICGFKSVTKMHTIENYVHVYVCLCMYCTCLLVVVLYKQCFRLK